MMKRVTKTELKNLRKTLPAGSIELISWKTGLSESSVRQILFKPERFNQLVITVALSISEKYTNQYLELKNKLKSIGS